MDRQLIEPVVLLVLFVALAFLAQGCVQRSQTGEEQIAVARRCEARGMNVVSDYRGFPWHDLEYAKCVRPPQGVTATQFLNGR